jgi:hypothetical protein
MKTFTSSSLALLAALASSAALAQSAPSLPLPSSIARPSTSPPLAPGLYVSVIAGLINVSNRGGTSQFTAGQFGFTATPTQPPIMVPKIPIQFPLPPSFSGLSSASGAGSGSGARANTVDCEIR